jgi:serine/threonine protein kinase
MHKRRMRLFLPCMGWDHSAAACSCQVADFGLARPLELLSSLSTGTCGTLAYSERLLLLGLLCDGLLAWGLRTLGCCAFWWLGYCVRFVLSALAVALAVSPELLVDCKLSFKLDIYSFGVVSCLIV